MNKKYALIFSVALSVALLDQFAKFFVTHNFKLHESVPIIKNILRITYIINTGSAFGLFQGFNLIFILFSIVVIIAIFYYMAKKIENKKILQFAVGLLLGGTLGNLIDRILHGAVIDFIDFRIWPVFNVADSAVTISIILLVIILWKK